MNPLVPDFAVVVSKMVSYLSDLKTVERSEINKVLKGLKGVYIFYENDIPVYVGKTDNLVRRLTEHGRAGSKNNDANFAFKIAKIEFLEANKMEKKITRKLLEDVDEFNKSFSNAKSRVNQMKMKYVTINDPYEQYLFEFYAALHFKTKYNEFVNH